MIVEIIFWFSMAFIVYTYFAYPILLFLGSFFRKRPVIKGNIQCPVSFIITAYNEEKNIHQKLENTLKQDYPSEELEVIVASDCSTDRTDEIVNSYCSNRVKLVRAAERKGKENAQKLAVEAASGDVLVFSDAATMLPPDGISKIVRNFYDPTVGCVSSEDRFVETDGKISGEGTYVRYEMILRNLESKVNTIVGLSGSFFAARKVVCQPWAIDLQSDFNTLLNSVRMGLRGVSDPESIGYYKNIADEKREFRRKVRTVLRGISVLMKSLPLLNPFKYGLFALQLISHKLFRWLIPFAMISAFISNAFLARDTVFYQTVFLIQTVFYLIAILGITTNLFPRNIIKLPSYLVVVNMSILNAWYLYVRGKRIVFWNPSER